MTTPQRDKPRVSAHLLVLFAALFLATTVQAQQFPSQQRGVSSDPEFQQSEIDSINLFNGQLSLNIPLGGEYPVGPGLSYGLSLSYNSNGWDYEARTCTNTQGQLERRQLRPDLLGCHY